MSRRYDDKTRAAAIERYKKIKNSARVAQLMGLPERTVRDWVNEWKRSVGGGDELGALQFRVRELEALLAEAERDRLDAAYVRSRIFGLKEQVPTPPKWLINTSIKRGMPGVPSLLCSDWHWGETVVPGQVNGVNEYNLAIAHRRARTLINKTISLLCNYTVNPEYPGMVVNLGGDMVSGDIHDELTDTNEMPIMPVVVDLFGVLIWAINALADKFGRVAVFCVAGNHGRNTRKKRSKNKNYTSFDWLLYALLEKHFLGDERVRIVPAEGSDLHYRVFDHRYVLTHGDQFYGGDGIIGALGPIIRGDARKRTWTMQVNREYDTLLMGHWHQYLPLDRVVVNGSLVGYNEYAIDRNFTFEPPRQALWITHPEHGMINRNPVYVDELPKAASGNWVSWDDGVDRIRFAGP